MRWTSAPALLLIGSTCILDAQALLVSPATEQCSTHQNGVLVARHCHSEESGRGRLLLRVEGSASPLMYVRFVGPAIEVIPVLSATPQDQMEFPNYPYVAPYQLCEFGTYGVEIVVLFRDFSDPNDLALVKKEHPCMELDSTRSSFTISLRLKLVARPPASFSGARSRDCGAKLARGYWVDPEVLLHAQNGDLGYVNLRGKRLSHTYVGDKKSKERTSSLYTDLRFKIKPGTCLGRTLARRPPQQAERPEGPRQVCAIGDSHLERVSQGLNNFTSYLSSYCFAKGIRGEFIGHISNCTNYFLRHLPYLDGDEHKQPAGLVRTTGQSQPNRKSSPLLLKRSSEGLKNMLKDTPCSDVILNFGSWELSFHMKESNETYSSKEYAADVYHMLSEMVKAARDQDVRIFWAAMPPFPFNKEVVMCPPEGFRFPHMLERYNEAAEMAISRSDLKDRVGFIDQYAVAKHVIDVSEDGNHYGGSILEAIVQNTVNCMSEGS
mmetsp:Transcript_77198/g.218475  ORF Transcript_77198/g.218475 Transcript_77198/m.218475 type:complete len:493 (+) Transcript_77198:69-1547(+)